MRNNIIICQKSVPNVKSVLRLARLNVKQTLHLVQKRPKITKVITLPSFRFIDTIWCVKHHTQQSFCTAEVYMYQYKSVFLFLLFSLPLFSMEMEVKLDFNQATQLLVEQAKRYWQNPDQKDNTRKNFKILWKNHDLHVRRVAVDKVLDSPTDAYASVFGCLVVYGGRYDYEEIGHLHACNTSTALQIKRFITQRNSKKMGAFLKNNDVIAAKTFLLTDNLLLDCSLSSYQLQLCQDSWKEADQTLWDWSCTCGDLDVFNSLVERAEKKDFCPAMVAFKRHHKSEWLKIFVERHQADVLRKRFDIWSKLIPAMERWCECSAEEESRQSIVFEAANSLLFPCIKDGSIQEALSHAVKQNCIPAIQVLLERIKVLDASERSPILNVALEYICVDIPLQVLDRMIEKTQKIIRLLLQAGADINATAYEGNTILHRCARDCYNQTKLIAFLLEQGARKDLPNDEGLLPQHYAQHVLVKALL
jgi:hypothetical protein